VNATLNPREGFAKSNSASEFRCRGKPARRNRSGQVRRYTSNASAYALRVACVLLGLWIQFLRLGIFVKLLWLALGASQ
jgi:hypothetical protein